MFGYSRLLGQTGEYSFMGYFLKKLALQKYKVKTVIYIYMYIYCAALCLAVSSHGNAHDGN